MALLAVLNHGDPSWNGNYAQIEFHSYNERYEGSYPNLYFCFDVQARIVAINSGWWMIQANTTFNYGGVQQTHGIYTGKVYGTSDWYFVGSHRKPCGCGRSFTFEDGCSVSGYPNLSGNGSITSPTIPAPAFTAKAENINQQTCDIVWDTTDNPYNMYRMYVKAPNGTYSSQLPMDGRYSLKGLSSNTSYTYRVEAWQADGRGSEVAGKNVTFKTLENYPEISVTEVTYEIEDAGETDNVTFRFKSTDDSHVSKWHYQIQGGPPFSGTSPTYSESRLAKNLESYIDVWTEDTLGRTSSKFRQYFHTTFTKMTVWRRMKTKGYQLFDASKLSTKSQGGATVTNNGDGSLTVSGSGTLKRRYASDGSMFNIPFLLKPGLLYLSQEEITNPTSYVDIYDASEKYLITIRLTKDKKKIAILLSDAIAKQAKKMSVHFVGEFNEPIIKGTVKPMLYQDGDGIWEPYTGGKPFDGYLRGFMYCIQNMLWGYARPYILNTGRKWLNALPYDIVRRFVFSGKTNAAGLEVHKIYGNTVQETTKGYQLFDASKIKTKTQGGATVTNNNDGSFTISGNGELSAQFESEASYPITVKAGLLKLDSVNKSCPYAYVDFYDEQGKFVVTISNVWSSKQQITISEEQASKIKKMIFYMLGRSGETITPGTIKPMLYQDGDGTWEPYTGGKPGPNPDAPLPIRNVEITKVTSYGKNLLNARLNTQIEANDAYTIPIRKINNYLTLYLKQKMITPRGDNIAQHYITFFNASNAVIKQQTIAVLYFTGTVGEILQKQQYVEIPDGTVKILLDLGSYFGVDRSPSIETLEAQLSYGKDVSNYESYKGNSIIQTNITLAKDDVYSKGTILRKRKKIVFDGSSDENWEKEISTNRYIIKVPNSNASYVRGECKCNRGMFYYDRAEPGVTFIYGGYLYYYPPTDISTLELFKSWLSTHPLEVEYPLQSPTTEYVTIPTITSFDPYTNAWTDSEVETQIEWRPAASSTLTERFYAVEQYRKVLNENT